MHDDRMYWRTRPDMGASANAPDWPRNGTQLQVDMKEQGKIQ